MATMSSYWNSNDTLKGVVLGLLAFVLVSSSMPLATVSVHAASGPYFSMTLIAPTSNPQRRQWAAIIQNSYNSANIDAKLIYVAFSQMLGILLGCANGCPAKAYAQGGWDAVFVGNGGGTSLPDFGTQNVAFYRNEGPGDIPPNGQDYYFFKNATFNALADDYNTNFDVNARLADAQKMVAIAAQERPGIIIEYPLQSYAYSSGLKPWNVNASGTGPSATAPITSSSEGIDYAHWNTGANTAINVAVTGNIDNVNQLPTAAQNSLYDRYIWGAIDDPLEQVDARAVGVYFNGIANSITSSADHKTWTVTFKAHNFQDGVPVTADDYIFSTMSSLRLDVGWVGGGTLQGLLGTNGAAFAQFTFSNGTSRYVSNGTFSATAPANFKPTTVWTSTSPTSFTFTMPTAYILTDPIITAFGALPMHIYEKVKASQWATSFLSGFTGSSGGLSNNKVTITYDKAKYGGNGSYAYVYGPIGDGAYMYRGYDPVSQTATLTQWSGYWNATGLQGMGQFTAKTIHIQSILAKDAAIAALGNKQVNFLDTNYTFNPQDITAMQKLGFTVVKVADPANGWQEMPLNDNAPIWGTGAGTPAGSLPGATAATQAAAARNVRKALSYLVPRQQIIDNLLGGLGVPGVTQYYPTAGVIKGGDIYSGIKANPYDPTAAASFLAAAGYNTGVPPPPPTITFGAPPQVTVPPTVVGGGPVPTISTSCTPVTVPTPTTTTVSVPTFLAGNTVTLTGAFPVVVAKGVAANGYAVTLQQSTDGGKSWTAVAFGATTTGGYYSLSYTPTVTGAVSYRVFFTGLPQTFLNALGPSSPSLPEAYVPPLAPGSGLPVSNTTATQYSSITSYAVGSLADVVSAITTSISAAITNSASITNANVNNGLCSLESSLATSINTALSTLSTQDTNNALSLKNSINGLGNSTNAALAKLSNQTQTALGGLQGSSASKSDVSTLSTNVGNLATQVNTLNGQISTLSNVAYAALGIALVLGDVAIGLTLRRK
jgi:ABC-type transport system substrate-binding protein